ncbi:MAG: 5'-methylthioadenosine/adenosylhomocysteine nucleosidase [Clostridiaceae bacterium]|nr:5'-methylthioadenosine/adenosylhomocysteine nucleosidase [Eubacteriales bacterium]
MKRIGIISAMWVEVDILHKAMQNIEQIDCCGMRYYKGRLGNANVVLSTCGVGKVNAAIYTQIMIDRFGVDTIFHTGVAGSMEEGVSHLSVVVADSLTYYDVRREQLLSLFPFQETFKADAALASMLLDCAGSGAKLGMILTGDSFISTAERKYELKAQYPLALCVEMEGCAVAHAAFVNGVPFGIIRCISDLANEDAACDYDDFEQRAAQRASGIVLKAIERIGAS